MTNFKHGKKTLSSHSSGSRVGASPRAQEGDKDVLELMGTSFTVNKGGS